MRPYQSTRVFCWTCMGLGIHIIIYSVALLTQYCEASAYVHPSTPIIFCFNDPLALLRAAAHLLSSSHLNSRRQSYRAEAQTSSLRRSHSLSPISSRSCFQLLSKASFQSRLKQILYILPRTKSGANALPFSHHYPASGDNFFSGRIHVRSAAHSQDVPPIASFRGLNFTELKFNRIFLPFFCSISSKHLTSYRYLLHHPLTSVQFKTHLQLYPEVVLSLTLKLLFSSISGYTLYDFTSSLLSYLHLPYFG